MDIRSLVRGVVLQALYELDTTQHTSLEVLKIRTDVDRHQDDVRLLGYLALRGRHRTTLTLPTVELIALPLNKPQDERLPFEQVLIDALTEGLPEDTVTDEHEALLERREEIPEVEEFDLRLEKGEDILPHAAQEQIIRLTRSILEQQAALDDIIHRYAPEYPVETLAVIDRNILRLAIYEFGVSRETPLSVAVNEAVELAKLFGSDSTPRFVNGVLGALGRSHDKILAELANQEERQKENS